MRHRALVLLGLVAVTTFCAASGKSEADKATEGQKEAVKFEAKKFLGTFAVPGPETQQAWGMTDFHAIGWGGVFPDVFNYAVDNSEINRIDEAAPYELVIQFWCKGTSPSGEPLKLRRTLYLKASTPDNGASWQIESPEFRNDQPLTFLRQLCWWLLCTFVILPVIIGIGLGLFSAGSALSNVGCFLAPILGWGASWLLFGATLLLPPVFAYSFFDSWVFTGICLIASVAVTRAIAKALPD